MKKSFEKSCIFFLIILFIFTGCSKNEESRINEKLDSEIEYIQDLIFKIANKIAKHEYMEDDKINWDYIKDDVLNINDSLSILILDLTEVKIKNEDIINFSDDLNNTIIAVSNKDENLLLQQLSDMSIKLNLFKESYSDKKSQIERNKIKSEILSVYSVASSGNYLLARENINKLIEKYKELMNDKEFAAENAYNLNKIYILLEEFSTSIQSENFDLIRMKYLSAVENM